MNEKAIELTETEKTERKLLWSEAEVWFRRRRLVKSRLLQLEVAALLAYARAEALASYTFTPSRYRDRIDGFERLAKAFRQEADMWQEKKRTL